MLFARKIVSYDGYPSGMIIPTSYTETLVASTEGAEYQVYQVTETGFYKIAIQAGGGHGGYHVNSTGAGGGTTQIVYLYSGQTCLLWSGTSGGQKGYAGTTGYPGTKGDILGGGGACGASRVDSEQFPAQIESGQGGGGPASNGKSNGAHSSYFGGGGAGSGFLAGFVGQTLFAQQMTAGDMTRNINYTLNAGAVTFSAITTYILCGGGGGACSDEGTYRAGGGGGGAFGNGGTTYNHSGTTGFVAATTGPAGANWGCGAASARYGGGANGAWAILDFSCNQLNWNQGGGSPSANGFCQLYKLTT